MTELDTYLSLNSATTSFRTCKIGKFNKYLAFFGKNFEALWNNACQLKYRKLRFKTYQKEHSAAKEIVKKLCGNYPVNECIVFWGNGGFKPTYRGSAPAPNLKLRQLLIQCGLKIVIADEFCTSQRTACCHHQSEYAREPIRPKKRPKIKNWKHGQPVKVSAVVGANKPEWRVSRRLLHCHCRMKKPAADAAPSEDSNPIDSISEAKVQEDDPSIVSDIPNVNYKKRNRQNNQSSRRQASSKVKQSRKRKKKNNATVATVATDAHANVPSVANVATAVFSDRTGRDPIKKNRGWRKRKEKNIYEPEIEQMWPWNDVAKHVKNFLYGTTKPTASDLATMKANLPTTRTWSRDICSALNIMCKLLGDKFNDKTIKKDFERKTNAGSFSRSDSNQSATGTSALGCSTAAATTAAASALVMMPQAPAPARVEAHAPPSLANALDVQVRGAKVGDQLLS